MATAHITRDHQNLLTKFGKVRSNCQQVLMRLIKRYDLHQASKHAQVPQWLIDMDGKATVDGWIEYTNDESTRDSLSDATAI